MNKKIIIITFLAVLVGLFLLFTHVNSTTGKNTITPPKQTTEEQNSEKNEPSTLPPEEPIAPDAKVAYLTFDDGPSKSTPKILEILKKNEIKATFFVNGKTAPSTLGYYKQIVDDGHAIGNHTYTHDFKTIYKSLDNFKNDFEKLQTLIFEQTGIKPDIFRYPGGSITSRAKSYGSSAVSQQIIDYLNSQNIKHIDWDIDSTDSSKKVVAKEVIISQVLEQTDKLEGNIVVLLHDGAYKETTVEALQQIIDELKKRGYVFDKLNKNLEVPQQIKQ